MVPKVGIAIVGTGFSGLGTAIRLKQAGIEDFVLLERAQEVGGVWRDNVYPGCACDVESHLYSFSFAPNPGWSRMFSAQPEIWEYLRRCADRFGIRPHIRFEHDVREARWKDGAWELDTTSGKVRAEVLVAGMGALSEPQFPKIPGLESFQGKVFHSARWDQNYSLEGKRVAVIGTGASAIQFVPEIQPKVAKLKVFQRTAPWVVPRMDRALTAEERKRFVRFPVLQKLQRLRLYALREFYGLAFRHPKLMDRGERIALRHMARAIKDPELRKRLTPRYKMGCKRILISNDYYPALAKPNVEVITDAIREIRPRSIITADGHEHEVDTLILGTGFRVSELPFAKLIYGRGGARLSDVVGDSPRAHLGTSIAGFPNFFVLQGPSTGLGHNSVVLIIEHQIRHVVRAIRYLRRKKIPLEPKQEAQDRFVAEVDSKMEGTVWASGGCKSWYLDKTGRNSTLWPGSVGAFGRRVAPFRSRDYRVAPHD